MAKKDPGEKRFEAALEEVEQIVEQMATGELSLEDALAAYEKGVGLVRFCNQKLNDVEKKIEMLVRDKEGKLELKELAGLAKENDGQ